ncbi:esterase [Lacinutrix sp. C3R15]|uniref:alpha/beta hydrolase n=1 Tax=Flavobacteriaceae TaxID=49546 RepID=UPI001C09960B|nr:MULTISPECIES: alpha/beta hydrolase-fold protein [Flavobacteriaceae]MBU2940907.1 esterase [Lacinutrix sp. C3R15]MDO6624226.1 alpha/beta hydrolase-fold protein [Oceanihabitans sp. 1_MG-2023]
MKALIYAILLLFTFQFTQAQVQYETIDSQKLNDVRQIKIQLPRGYDEDTNKNYPLIVVFDGDYMFEIVAGNVDYYSYWEDMPEAIVIGVNQSSTRSEDTSYSEQSSMPIDTGADFFEFVGMELIPYIEKSYRTENFNVAIGHGETANFINSFLFKASPLFQAYISISPDLATNMKTYLPERLQGFETKLFYYLATSTNDVKFIKEKTEALHANLSALDNKNVLYNFDTFEGPSHYALPAHAVPKALESIFLVYQPISKKEYKETILKLEGSPVTYLLEKYQTIEDLFGIKKPILVNDFKAIAAAINKSEQYNYYEELGKLARKQYPETMLGNYYMARFYEETNDPKKAMKTYQSAYMLEEIAGLTKDLMLEKSDAIKADFGY